MKLEPKHIAPYLPYEVIVQSPVIVYTEGENPIPSHEDIQEGVLTVDDLKNDLGYLRPILRPLSDLTKEIERHGEKFIPIIALYPLFNKQPPNVEMICNQEVDYAESHYYGGEALKINTKYPLENRYDLLQKLFEWHFDVFGLIDEGLAIKKD